MASRVFHHWISEKLDLFILIIMSIFLSFTNGLPATISSYVVGGQAGMAEDVSMAGYAYYAGMTCSIPFIFRITKYASKKQLLIVIHLLLLVMNYIISESSVTTSVMMASFLIGFIRIIGSIVLLEAMMPLLMPRGERYQMYSVYYPLAIVMPAVSAFIATYIAHNYHWQMSFLFDNILLLINLLIVVSFIHPGKQERRIPMYQFDWPGAIFFAAGLLFVAYACCYGLTLDWFRSPDILISFIAALFFMLLFSGRTVRVRKPFLRFSTFKLRASIITLSVLFLFGMFYSSSNLASTFTSIIVPGNPLKAAEISTYSVIGYLSGSIISFFYFRRTKNNNIIFAFSSLCYLLSNIIIFVNIHPQASPDWLVLSMILRGMAIICSYIAAGVYLAANVPQKSFMPCIPFLIMVRSFVGPLFWGTLLSNVLYIRRIFYATMLGSRMDAIDPLVLMRGKTMADNSIRIQSSLLALRDIYGWLIIAGAVLTLILLVFPFHASKERQVFNWLKKSRSEELVQALPM